jgi:hypothetical protein
MTKGILSQRHIKFEYGTYTEGIKRAVRAITSMHVLHFITYLHGINTPSLPYIIQNKPGLLPPQPEQANIPEMAFEVKRGMFIKLWHAMYAEYYKETSGEKKKRFVVVKFLICSGDYL